MKDIRAFFQSKNVNASDKGPETASSRKSPIAHKRAPEADIEVASKKKSKENIDVIASSRKGSPSITQAVAIDPDTFYAKNKPVQEDKVAPTVKKRKSVVVIDSDDSDDGHDVDEGNQAGKAEKKELLKGMEQGLLDLRFYLLGKFKQFSALQYSEMIKMHGGKISQKPTRTVTFAVIGEGFEIDDLDKVHAAKCKTIDEDGLINLIVNGSPSASSTSKIMPSKVTEESLPLPETKKSNKRKQPAQDDEEFVAPINDTEEIATKSEESSTPKKKFNYREFLEKKSAPATERGSREPPIGKENCLAGLTVVFTGDSKYITRDEAQDLVKRYGGKVTSGPSRKTSFVVVGENPGPSKMEKIKALSIKVMNEDEFFDFIEAQPEKEGEKVDYAEKAKELEEQLRETPKPSKLPDQNNKMDVEVVSSSIISKEKKTVEQDKKLINQMDSSMLWTEKYAPTQIKDIIGNKSNVEKLETWLKSWKSKVVNGDKSFQRAALISGPPGIGKTTSAAVVSKCLGYDIIEFNASDTRSKKSLDEHVKEILFNKSISQYFGPKSSVSGNESLKKQQVLIMDEVDGMSSGDRGGITELIQFIKKTRTPIICVCNDRSSTKVRNLANYCLDLRFRRPDASQVRSRIMTIAYRENLKVQAAAVDQLVQGTQGDIRQILNILFTWKMTEDSLDFDSAKEATKKSKKNFDVGLFDLTSSFFTASNSMSVSEKLENYFLDYSFVPLMVQENYIKINTDIEHLSRAADSLSEGDLFEAKIRGINQSWSLAPAHGIMSCVRPSFLANGRLNERIDFTSWLGNFSKENKYLRILKDLTVHTSLITLGDRMRLRLEYIPTLMKALINPLIEMGSDGVEKVIDLLDAYYLTKDDYDVVLEYSLDSKFDGKVKGIPSAVKSSLTRAYNKRPHSIPYAIGSIAASSGRRGGGLGAMQADEEAEVEMDPEDNDDDDAKQEDDSTADQITKDKSIKAKTSGSSSKASKSSRRKK